MSGGDFPGRAEIARRLSVALIAVIFLVTVTGELPAKENDMLIGVYEPNSPGSYGEIDSFAIDAGFSPRIVSYYATFTSSFSTAFAVEAAAKGATVLVQWQPRGTTNAAVAAGTDDAFIQQFAQAVATVNRQVIISYGQEMNGNWYNWGTNGAGNSNPTDYVAAYQHIHDIFQAENVRNVTWLWDPNVSYGGSTPLNQVYPGDAYVDWVGLDGYFHNPTDTFSSVFGESIIQLRTFTSKPLLIGESGVWGAAGASQIAVLFSGASQAGAIGVVYFDQAGSPDWRLEDNAANMAAFKAAVLEYAEPPDPGTVPLTPMPGSQGLRAGPYGGPADGGAEPVPAELAARRGIRERAAHRPRGEGSRRDRPDQAAVHRLHPDRTLVVERAPGGEFVCGMHLAPRASPSVLAIPARH
jgi:mannan endo-1,4-beta-mannosidase